MEKIFVKDESQEEAQNTTTKTTNAKKQKNNKMIFPRCLSYIGKNYHSTKIDTDLGYVKRTIAFISQITLNQFSL
jgi:hypothetical protein